MDIQERIDLMKVDNLEVGQVVKNYKELCTLLELDVKAGNSRKAQIKELERFIDYEKKGHSFIVKEIYSEPLEVDDARSNGNNRKYDSFITTHQNKCKYILNNLNVLLENETCNSTKELLWKCSICHISFIDSIKKITTQEYVRCHKCSRSKGSYKIYEILELYNISFKGEIIFDDLVVKRNLRFDYGLFKENEIVALIEYDGEYHDINRTTQEYDRIKDEYCKTNNIPLLRIHHTEIKYLEVNLLSFLYRFYPTTVIANELLAASRKIEIENQKLLDKVETNNKILKDLLEVIK